VLGQAGQYAGSRQEKMTSMDDVGDRDKAIVGPKEAWRGEGIVCPPRKRGDQGEVPTCTNGVTTWTLSQREAR
jgi:hypothetical protein